VGGLGALGVLVVKTLASHTESKNQKAETEEQQSESFAGEFEKTSCIHLKGL
jgi:hypothetical protein